MATPTLNLLFLRQTSDTAEPTCTTAVPDHYGHVAEDACNSYYLFYPNFGVNLAFAIVFAFSTMIHLGQAVLFKKRYAWVIIMGCLWEIIAFAVRADGAHKQQSITHIVIGALFLLLAPLWLNAFCFMTVARLIHYVVPNQSIWRIKAVKMTKIFVWLDVISFNIQAIGGTMLSQDELDVAEIGRKIYMSGVAFQFAFIVAFLAIIVKFFLMILAKELDPQHVKVRRIMIQLAALAICLILIIVRIVYRLVEFGEGANEENTLLQSEWYSIGLDGVPMLLAFYLMNIFHPGFVLKGPDSEFPKVTRAEKKEIKQAKKEAKEAAKEIKMQNTRGITDNTYEMSDRASPV